MRKLLFATLLMVSVISTMGKMPEKIMPRPLHEGSKIAIVTPASAIKSSIIDETVVRLKNMGYEPVVMPHAHGSAYGSYATNDENRAAELMAAFADPEIDAILCSRGGYGTVRLLPLLNMDVIRNNPKWLVGYSDISDVLAYMYHAGVASIHGPMAAHLASNPDTILPTKYLFQTLTNQFPLTYTLRPEKYNKSGQATGRLVGGNLLTINGLSETQYDIMNIGDDDDIILFVEDVSEQIYAIERVLMRMHYSGMLGRLRGLIIGQFTEYGKSEDFESMEQMIYYWLNHWGYYNESNPMPIVFNFPTGHVTDNYPMIVGAEVELSVSPDSTSMTFTGR